MARSNNNLTAVLQDTANAIKAKKGDQTAICPRDFGDEITNLPTGGSGTIEITTNGLHDVAQYGTADVNVPGYPEPTGSVTYTTNGTYDIKDKAEVVVNVPGPTGIKRVYGEGLSNVSGYEMVNVDVRGYGVLFADPYDEAYEDKAAALSEFWTAMASTSMSEAGDLSFTVGVDAYLSYDNENDRFSFTFNHAMLRVNARDLSDIKTCFCLYQQNNKKYLIWPFVSKKHTSTNLKLVLDGQPYCRLLIQVYCEYATDEVIPAVIEYLNNSCGFGIFESDNTFKMRVSDFPGLLGVNGSLWVIDGNVVGYSNKIEVTFQLMPDHSPSSSSSNNNSGDYEY